MSDTEVTVTRSDSGKWWRMEFRGYYDFLEAEPTAQDKVQFRQSVTAQIAQANRAKSIAKNGSGRGNVQVVPYINGRG